MFVKVSGKILVDILELLFFQTAFVLWFILKVWDKPEDNIVDVERKKKFGQDKDIVEPKSVLFNLNNDILKFVVEMFY